MSKSSKIEKIDKQNLCLGCGLCESVCGKDVVEMQLGEDGFIHPKVKKIVPDKEAIIERICPGLNVVNDIDFAGDESVWGHIEKLYSGFTTDKEARQKGSSGGVISGLAIYALDQGLVDGILQVGGDASDYQRNTLKISYSKDDVLNCASSRYAPAAVFNDILDILNQNDHHYMFVGKPCDISALKNFLLEFPEYTSRFKLTVSIICAGIPSFQGTKAIIDEFKAKEPVKDLVYRGNGWPGYFSFKDKSGERFQRTYNDSWGKTLNRHLNFRCKVCPDGIGIQADIAVGDAWETKDGYPDFAEKDGQSLIITRTTTGTNFIAAAQRHSYVVIAKHLDVSILKIMQPYQYKRRTRLGARLAALYIRKGIKLNFRNLAISKNLKQSSSKDLIREFVGTYKRLR